MNRKR